MVSSFFFPRKKSQVSINEIMEYILKFMKYMLKFITNDKFKLICFFIKITFNSQTQARTIRVVKEGSNSNRSARGFRRKELATTMNEANQITVMRKEHNLTSL